MKNYDITMLVTLSNSDSLRKNNNKQQPTRKLPKTIRDNYQKSA